MKLMQLNKIRNYTSKKIDKFKDIEWLGSNICTDGKEANIFFKQNGKDYQLTMTLTENSHNNWVKGIGHTNQQ